MNKTCAQNLRILKKYHQAIFDKLSASSPFPKSGIKEENLSFPDSGDLNDGVISPYPDSFQKIEDYLLQGLDFLYVAGIGNGNGLCQIYSSIVNHNRGIAVIEPDMHAFFQVLQSCDLRNLFSNQRIFWLIGEPLQEQIQHLFDQTLCFAAAKPFFLVGGDSSAIYADWIDYIKKEMTRRKTEIAAILKNIPLRLQEKQPGSIKRIWTYSDLRGKAGYSIIQHKLLRTLFYELQQRGYEICYTVMRDGQYYPPYYRILQMALFEPDMIFLCNEAPGTEISLGAEFCHSLPIPKTVWFADDPLYGEHLLERNKLGEDEYYLVADYEWKDTLIRHGAQFVEFMPGAVTNTRRGRKRNSRKCEIVFVGQVRDNRLFFSQLSPEWKRYAQQVITEKLRFPRRKIRDIMEQFSMPSPLRPDYLDEFRQKVLWEANTQFRLQVIRSLWDFDLQVYGNPDWLALLPGEKMQKCFRGVLPFKHLYDVYRNAAVVLNIHSLQSYTCMNVRDFDVPAAGGFLLSDWLPKSDEVYNPGFVSDLPLQKESDKDVFFYRSIPELLHLTRCFLLHPEERASCIERARQKVIENHTYKNRAEFLHILFNRIKEGMPNLDFSERN